MAYKKTKENQMKTASKIALGVLIMCLPLMAFAQPMAGPHPALKGKMHDELNLTDEQQTQVEALALAHQKQMMTLNNQLRDVRTQMKLLVTKDNPATADVKKLADQIGQFSSQIAQENANHKIAVRNLLTAEQKVKFDMKILSGRHRMGRGGRGMGMNRWEGCAGCSGPMGHGMGQGMGQWFQREEAH
jgi:Spy/CpxP family protein refolding chaperone